MPEPDKALIYTDHMSDIMGPDKSSSLVTILSNCMSLLRGGLVEGEWGSLGWRLGQTIAGIQDFILGAVARFQLCMDFMEGCHMWDPRGHTYNVLVRLFPCRVYTDSNHRDTLGYKWPLAHSYHLVVCLVVLMDCLGDYGYGYDYHG
jgi:hypothetical protein